MADAAAPDGGREQVFRLIYRSQSRIPAEDLRVTLGDIFSQARSHNKKKHITGALLVSGDWFAQVLEGDESLVRALYATISQDARHDHVTLLRTRPKAHRLFSRWSMARVSAEGAADIPLIAHTDGISPAAGHKITPEQESVLRFMREATAAAHTQF